MSLVWVKGTEIRRVQCSQDGPYLCVNNATLSGSCPEKRRCVGAVIPSWWLTDVHFLNLQLGVSTYNEAYIVQSISSIRAASVQTSSLFIVVSNLDVQNIMGIGRTREQVGWWRVYLDAHLQDGKGIMDGGNFDWRPRCEWCSLRHID